MINYQTETPPKRARIILSEHMTDEHSLDLSPVVYVIGGPFPDAMGYPHWLIVRPVVGATPEIVTKLRFE
jgi:hypothetical protein